MLILVACEESQALCIELRKRGHTAFSCDIQEESGGPPEWHIHGDVLPLLNGHCSFTTRDGTLHSIGKRWDMIFAFPPCTHLCSSGSRYFEQKRKDGRQQQAIDFFMAFVNADCERIVIENPVGIMSSVYRKPDQIIQPWQHGHGETKRTCLWIHGDVPLLQPSNIVEGRETIVTNMCDRKDRSKLRSKTYPGIAKAIAEQMTLPAYPATA